VHPNEPADGPYLIGAFFCEKILREGDGVLSFIRVVDRWNIRGTAERMPPTVIQTHVVVMMKSGSFRGTANITLTPTTPSGQQMPAIPIPVVFEGDNDRGVSGAGPIAFPVSESGAYWFTVDVDGRTYTRTAIRITYLRVPSVPQPPQ
jgi:hypothetical protein